MAAGAEGDAGVISNQAVALDPVPLATLQNHALAAVAGDAVPLDHAVVRIDHDHAVMPGVVADRVVEDPDVVAAEHPQPGALARLGGAGSGTVFDQASG